MDAEGAGAKTEPWEWAKAGDIVPAKHFSVDPLFGGCSPDLPSPSHPHLMSLLARLAHGLGNLRSRPLLGAQPL